MPVQPVIVNKTGTNQVKIDAECENRFRAAEKADITTAEIRYCFRMATTTAYLVLYSWPLVVIFLFKRFPLQEALGWSMVSGYLLLPNIVLFDLPLIPPFNKHLVGNLSIAIVCVVMAIQIAKRQKAAIANAAVSRRPAQKSAQVLPEFTPRRGRFILASLMILMFATTFITVAQNREQVFWGPKVLQALSTHDTLSICLGLLITIMPFLLGRRFLQTSEAHLMLLKIIVIACLGYSLLAFWEIRFSPQLNFKLYGFHPHIFSQSIRGDGFRPIVFTGHGLILAITFAMASMSAMAIWRDRIQTGDATKWLIASIYLLIVLVLCKSLGALIILVLLLPVFFLFGIGVQLLIAAVISAIILTYPVLRGADLIPTEKVLEIATSIDAKRAGSLDTRFENEDRLLEHANKKPLAGWGSWGRNRVYSETGANISITDGLWVIIIGTYGWLGYISQFGLLGLAIILLALNRRRLQLTAATSGLALVQAGAMVDLIPNASISPLTWLIAGALMGRYQTAEAVVKEKNIRNLATRRQREEPQKPAEVAAGHGDTGNFGRPLHQRRPREG